MSTKQCAENKERVKLSHPVANGWMVSAGSHQSSLRTLSEVELKSNIWLVSSWEEISGIFRALALLKTKKVAEFLTSQQILKLGGLFFILCLPHLHSTEVIL